MCSRGLEALHLDCCETLRRRTTGLDEGARWPTAMECVDFCGLMRILGQTARLRCFSLTSDVKVGRCQASLTSLLQHLAASCARAVDGVVPAVLAWFTQSAKDGTH